MPFLEKKTESAAFTKQQCASSFFLHFPPQQFSNALTLIEIETVYEKNSRSSPFTALLKTHVLLSIFFWFHIALNQIRQNNIHTFFLLYLSSRIHRRTLVNHQIKKNMHILTYRWIEAWSSTKNVRITKSIKKNNDSRKKKVWKQF